jgi:hypothetical protein
LNKIELLGKAAHICSKFVKDFDYEEVRRELQLADERVGGALLADMEARDSEKTGKLKALMEILTSDGATRVYKGSIADHIYEYRYWLTFNYNNIIKPLLNPPAPSGNPRAEQLTRKFQYNQKHKTTTRWRKLTEGRSGTYLRMFFEFESSAAAASAKWMADYMAHPEKCVYYGSGVPTEIIWAMGLTPYGINLQEAVRSQDQKGSLYYLDACSEAGVPLDTCTFPQIGAGAALRNDYLEGFPCAVLSNLTCDPMLASHALTAKLLDVPTFYFDHPYRFRTPDGSRSFASQMRDMVSFLEKHTGHTLDWDKLRDICDRYNQMQEMELERWEHNYGPNPPIPGDLLLNMHLKLFGPFSGTEDGLAMMKRQLELTRAASAKGESCVPNQQYRVVLWNPPPGSYWNFNNWISQCWGVNILNDMETFGNFEFIDTSSEETIFETLGRKTMYFTMSRHTRGDLKNFFDDLFKLCELSKPDFIIQADHVGCHPVNALRGLLTEECAKRGLKLMRFEQDLGDVRVTSHQGVRDQVNNFMTNVMNATPLKKSLMVFDDSNEW